MTIWNVSFSLETRPKLADTEDSHLDTQGKEQDFDS